MFSHPPHPSETSDLNPQSKSDLYLPPILSSLPDSVAITSILNPSFPPLLTETRLPDIDRPSLSLHKALHHFKPITPDYANTPYDKAFNWSELRLPKDEEREWFCVAFRSKRKAGSDGISLYDADKLAHDEAIRHGGLILYWYGVPNPETGMNLATCIWQSRKQATEAASSPNHVKAKGLADGVYDVYSLERHVLRKVQGEEGVTIETFIEGEVGW
jgi:hypothetical protein